LKGSTTNPPFFEVVARAVQTAALLALQLGLVSQGCRW
jgi:hypothetical protein